MEYLLRTKALAVFFFVFASTAAWAGWVPQPYPHAITSPDGRFVLTFIPGPSGIEHSGGKGICYEISASGEFTPRWETQGWYSLTSKLHWDGDSVVRIHSFASDDQHKAGEPAMALSFYYRGQLKKRYTINDLVNDPSKLSHTTAGIGWTDSSFEINMMFSGQGETHFHLKTIDGVHYVFDAATGEIVRRGEVL